MDTVRFGRALGFGARSAAKALAGAVDAATAPNPTPKAAQPQPPVRSAAAPTRPVVSTMHAAARATAQATAQAKVQARQTRKGLAQGSKRFGEAVWGPFVKLSGVLWLEITGSFFGIFALFAGHAAWAHRADIRPTPGNHDVRLHLLLFVGMTALFGYFCISSFVRAYRR
jgi:hypothetical protein